jgi:hypothetical protein
MLQTALQYPYLQTLTVPSTEEVAHTTWCGAEAAPAKATAVMRTGPCGLSICSTHNKHYRTRNNQRRFTNNRLAHEAHTAKYATARHTVNYAAHSPGAT